jgi:antitoxin (DNA-binding transcriptional repressor) of toxin-antitoxin stability system
MGMKSIDIGRLMDVADLAPSSGDSIVLLSDGRPVALVVGLREDEDAEQVDRWIRQARAQQAVSRVRRSAERAGVSALSAEEIDAEIRAARVERRM